MVVIGVLSVQGAFQEHIEILTRIGVKAIPVRLVSFVMNRLRSDELNHQQIKGRLGKGRCSYYTRW